MCEQVKGAGVSLMPEDVSPPAGEGGKRLREDTFDWEGFDPQASTINPEY